MTEEPCIICQTETSSGCLHCDKPLCGRLECKDAHQCDPNCPGFVPDR